MENLPRLRNRPYDLEIAQEILGKISEGRSLREICRQDGFPSVAAIFEWLHTTPEFAEQYARARSEQADALADEILAISDEKPAPIQTEDGPVFDPGFHQQQRLRVDARKWVASKLKPKKYGEKLAAELTGTDGGPIQHQAVERRIVDPTPKVGE